MNIQELKLKSSEQLITQAEKLGIENASTLRKQEILFAILKKVAEKEEITGAGVLQLLQDGFGFLRAMESNYLPGPDDIYLDFWFNFNLSKWNRNIFSNLDATKVYFGNFIIYFS